MKKQPVNPLLKVMKNAFLLVLFLIGSTMAKAGDHEDAKKKTLGVFINDKQLRIDVDSLAINAKGTLTLHALVNESFKAGQLKFAILIRHRSFAGNVLLFPWDEKFKNGEAINAIDVSKILSNVKPGDQLIIIPFDSESGNESAHEQLLITVTGDNC